MSELKVGDRVEVACFKETRKGRIPTSTNNGKRGRIIQEYGSLLVVRFDCGGGGRYHPGELIKVEE